MLNKLKNRKQEGFTIIEVLIVLAIAGLIILIVLLAVPALQRNGRNTTLKTDAGAVAGAVSEFAANNDGSAPDASGVTGGSTCSAGTLSLQKTGKVASAPKIQGGTGVVCSASGAQTAVTPNPSELDVVFGAKCGTVSTDAKSFSTIANTRGTAIVYTLETQGGVAAKCTDS